MGSLAMESGGSGGGGATGSIRGHHYHHHLGGGSGSSTLIRPSRCLLLLQRCLAIRLQRVCNLAAQGGAAPTSTPPRSGQEFWMYDSGYRLFQSLLDANLRCFWNASLLEAMRQLQFQGYVAPGVLLVSADACALEVVRAAWGRKTLQPPSNYVITVVGDVEECLVQALPQSQFTPLPEALCWVVLELTSAGQPASLEAVRSALLKSFPAVSEPPSEHTVYDALAKLMQERKMYHTSRGYFVVTPESRRRRSNSSGRCSSRGPTCSPARCASAAGSELELRPKTVLMSTDEALAYIHGEMETVRDGELTHQAVQTNLADVICGGNPNDKILYARVRPASSPAGRLLERRHSLRLFGSKKRLSQSTSLPRCGSMRLSPLRGNNTLDWGDIQVKQPEKSPSFLQRLFRRSGSSKRHSRADDSPESLSTFSAQFPPLEWFNPSVVHLHSVGTQTRSSSYSLASTRQSRDPLARSQGSLPWSDDLPSRAATLPRRRRHLSGDTNLTLPSNGTGSYTNTPRSSRKSSNAPSSNGTLPRVPSRGRSSSSSGSKLNGSPGTSITGAPSSVITASASPSRKISPAPVPKRSLQPNTSSSTIPAPLPVLPSLATPMFTLQVSSRSSPHQEKSSDLTTTAAISSGPASTRLTVLQSPNRSVVTLNGSPVALNGSPALSVNGSTVNGSLTGSTIVPMDSPKRRGSRPSSLYSPREKKVPPSPPATTTVVLSTAKRFPSVENLGHVRDPEDISPSRKVANNISQSAANKPPILSKPSNNENNNPESLPTPAESMNNIIDLGRKKSETLSSLKNLLYSSNTELNSLGNSSAALKSLDKSLKASDSMNLMENVGKVPASPALAPKAVLDDDLLLDKMNGDLHSSYPSLSDLSVHFKSLTAQKILKGISINSIDTLVEVNMAAATNEKQNNCDVTVHTDFGLV